MKKYVKIILGAILTAFMFLPFTSMKVQAATYDCVKATQGDDISNFVKIKIFSSAADAITYANSTDASNKLVTIDSEQKKIVLVYSTNGDWTYNYIEKTYDSNNSKWSDWVAAGPITTGQMTWLNLSYPESHTTICYYMVAKYTVTFDANGHGTAPASQISTTDHSAPNYRNQTLYVAEPDAPTAEGYTFGGWYKEAKCINAWNFEENKVSGDTTLYAKWTANAVPAPAASKNESDNKSDQKNDSSEQKSDSHQSDLDSYSVMVSVDNNSTKSESFKAHAFDNRTTSNQKLLAEANAVKIASMLGIKNPKTNILWNYTLYPRKYLSLTENGSDQVLTVKVSGLSKGSVVYAQCYSQKDGAYVLPGIVNVNGYAVFNNYILRDAVNVTIFTIQ